MDQAMNTTSYSREEIAEARQGLKLLKERMNNLGMGKRKGTTQSGHRERSHYNNSYAGSSGTSNSQNHVMPQIQSALPNNNRRSQYGNIHHTQSANKPPMIPNGSQANGANDVMNTSSLSGVGNTSTNALGRGYSGPTGTTPRSLGTGGQSNYRRAFKPQLTPGNNTSASAAFSTLNSDERLGGHQGQNQFYENPIQNRQSLNNKMFGSDQAIKQPGTFYEPSRRSPNMARRQINRDSDQSTTSAFANARSTPHQYNPSYDKYGDQRGGNQPTPTNHRQIPMSGQNPLQQSRDLGRQSGYQPGNYSQNGPGAYDSRKYSGLPPSNNQRQMAHKPEGLTRSTNSYRQPSPLKNLKQSMDVSANDGQDPFASKSKMQHTPPQNARPKPITAMKQQPKQYPQVGSNMGGYQGYSGGYGDEQDNQYQDNGGYQNQYNYNQSPQNQQYGNPSEPTEQPSGNDQMDRVPCQFCGRKFAPESIEKHERICQKTHNQKRKVFDTKDQRKAENADKVGTMNEFSKPFGLKKSLNKKGASGGASKVDEAPAANAKKMPKWKIQSLQFRQAMMAANGGSNAASTTGTGFRPVQEMSGLDEIADDRIQCKWCNRKFNKEAGERHFKHCEDQYKKNLMKQGNNKKQQTKRGTQVGFMKKKY